MVGQVERDAAVSFAQRFDAGPDDLARSHQRVQHRRLIACDARRQDLALEHRGGEWRALQLLDRVEQRFGAATHGADAVPRRRETVRARRRDRFDLAPQPRERAAAQAPQHVGIDPFALDAAGPELAFDEPPRFGQSRQQRLGDRRAEAESSRERVDGERAVRAREAQREIAGRIAHRLEQRLREGPAAVACPSASR